MVSTQVKERLAFRKVIRPHGHTFCEITITTDGRLSISGVEGPKRNGDCVGSCGQIAMHYEHQNPAHNDKRNKSEFQGKTYDSTIYADTLSYAPGWSKDLWFQFLDVWHTWHLNDMQSACEHQRALGWTYESHGQVVTSSGVWVDANTGTLKTWNKRGECPTCGYSIGSAWLTMELPQSVIEFLRSLPDTDMTPAWV